MSLLNQKGLTLLEVLLSVTILMIILVTIIKFFPQMGMMNKINGDKQQAVNYAKEELIYWQNANFKDFLLNSNESSFATSKLPSGIKSDVTYHKPYYILKAEDKIGDFFVEIWLEEEPDLVNGPTKANVMIIKIVNDKNSVVSETYGYTFYEVGRS